jgi:hypothetical protein
VLGVHIDASMKGPLLSKGTNPETTIVRARGTRANALDMVMTTMATVPGMTNTLRDRALSPPEIPRGPAIAAVETATRTGAETEEETRTSTAMKIASAPLTALTETKTTSRHDAETKIETEIVTVTGTATETVTARTARSVTETEIIGMTVAVAGTL